LTQAAQDATPAQHRPQVGAESNEVEFFIVLTRKAGKYLETQWVGKHNLGAAFETTYADEAALPYRVLTWNLADEADYGSGLVGDCENDFAALSVLSQALIEGAILASEYRWLLSPGSSMRPEDFKASENGGIIPGVDGDLSLVNAAGALAGSLQVQQQTLGDYVNRIGRTFLLSSAMTRDAERVTAEEIRLMAQELETGLGGGYSRMAVDVQLPLGVWLIGMTGVKFTKTEAQPTVVTGLDALSRNGDLSNLRGFMEDVVRLGALPPEVLTWLKLDVLFTDLGTGHGVTAGKYVETAKNVAAKQQQQQQAAVSENIATEAGKAAAQGAVAQ